MSLKEKLDQVPLRFSAPDPEEIIKTSRIRKRDLDFDEKINVLRENRYAHKYSLGNGETVESMDLFNQLEMDLRKQKPEYDLFCGALDGQYLDIAQGMVAFLSEHGFFDYYPPVFLDLEDVEELVEVTLSKFLNTDLSCSEMVKIYHKKRTENVFNGPFPDNSLITKPTFKDKYELILPATYSADLYQKEGKFEVRNLAKNEDIEVFAEYLLKNVREEGCIIPEGVDGTDLFIALKFDQAKLAGVSEITLPAFYHMCGFTGSMGKESAAYLLSRIEKGRSINVLRRLYVEDKKTGKRKRWTESSGYEVGPIEKRCLKESFMFLPITSWREEIIHGQKTIVFHIGEENRLFAIARERENATKQLTASFNIGVRLDNTRSYSMNEQLDRFFSMRKSRTLKQDAFSISNLFSKCPDCTRYTRSINDLIYLLDHRKQYNELYDYLIDCPNDKFYLFWTPQHKSALKKKYHLQIKRGERVIRKRKSKKNRP